MNQQIVVINRSVSNGGDTDPDLLAMKNRSIAAAAALPQNSKARGNARHSGRGHTFLDVAVEQEGTLRKRRNQAEFKLCARSLIKSICSLVFGLGDLPLLVASHPIPTHTGSAPSRPNET